MCPVCVFAGVGSGGEDQKVGQAIVMAYHGGKKEGMEMKRRKRLMCVEIGEAEYEETFENEVLMRMDLERFWKERTNIWPKYYWQILRLLYEEEMTFVEISEELHIPQGTVRNAHYRMKNHIKNHLDA